MIFVRLTARNSTPANPCSAVLRIARCAPSANACSAVHPKAGESPQMLIFIGRASSSHKPQHSSSRDAACTLAPAGNRAVLMGQPDKPHALRAGSGKKGRRRVTSSNSEEREPERLRMREAAALLGVSPWTVRRMVHAGELEAIDVRGMLRVDRASVDQYVNEHKHNNKPDEGNR